MFLTLRIQSYRKQAPAAPVERRFDQLGGSIGRSAGNDLELPDPGKYISRNHSKIDFADGRYTLMDLGANPSWINDRPVGTGKSAPLEHGDRLLIGDYVLEVLVGDGPAPAVPVFQPETSAALPFQAQPSVAPSPYEGPSFDEMRDALAGEKILDISGAHDPLTSPSSADPLGLNMLGDGQAPQGGNAAPLGFRGSEPDHAPPQFLPMAAAPGGVVQPLFHPQQHAPQPQFLQPAMPPAAPFGADPTVLTSRAAPRPAAPPAAPSGFGSMIPDDYDPLADFLPARVNAPAPAAQPGGWPAPGAGPAQPNGGWDGAPQAGGWPAPQGAYPQQGAAYPQQGGGYPQQGMQQGGHPGAQPAMPGAYPHPAPGAQAGMPAPYPGVQPGGHSAAHGGGYPGSQPGMPAAGYPAAGGHYPAPAVQGARPGAYPVQAGGAAMGGPGGDEFLQALLRGLGLTGLRTTKSPIETAELVGAMLREATSGTMAVLMARAMTKRESRLEMTVLGSQANNPLKFFPDAESALSQMLTNALSGYMPPVKSIGSAFEDLKAHELAVIAGMRAALDGVLARFNPALIEAQEPEGVMDKITATARKARMWDRMVALHDDILREADDDFQHLFGDKFSAAYEDQIGRLHRK